VLFLLFVPILQELGPLIYLKFKAKLIEVHERKISELICKRFFNCRSHRGHFKECKGNRKMKMDVIERIIIQNLESEKVKRDVNSSGKFNCNVCDLMFVVCRLGMGKH
jgi:hypothetical protein